MVLMWICLFVRFRALLLLLQSERITKFNSGTTLENFLLKFYSEGCNFDEEDADKDELDEKYDDEEELDEEDLWKRV